MNLPIKNIMQVSDWPDSKSFRIGCECQDPNHDVWMSVSLDKDIKDITLEFYVRTQTPFWKEGFNRFKIAWEVLIKGYYESEHHLMLDKQSSLNLVNTLKNMINRLEKEKQ